MARDLQDPEGMYSGPPADPGSLRVPTSLLLVDGDTRAVKLLGRMLREDGYRVEVAHDGARAIGRLAADPLPNILITELRIQHVDGLAVARYARSRQEAMPVVFLTGYPHLVHKRSSLEPTPQIHTKPVDYAAFRKALKALV